MYMVVNSMSSKSLLLGEVEFVIHLV